MLALSHNFAAPTPMMQAGAARTCPIGMQYYKEDSDASTAFTQQGYSSRLAEEVGERGQSIGGWDGAEKSKKNTVNDLIGCYSLAGIVFDPLNLAEKYDIDWMREAEIKHGRVTMLAIVGFLANDAGLKFPGEVFQGVSSTDAHDAMVESGHMWGLLAFVGTCELFHASVIVRSPPHLTLASPSFSPHPRLTLLLTSHSPSPSSSPHSHLTLLLLSGPQA